MRGFTLVEIIVALGIFAFLAVAAGTFFVSGFRMNDRVWDQLSTQADMRRVFEQFRRDARELREGADGSSPIERAAADEFIFFADVLGDNTPERVRYTRLDTALVRGITAASGTPPAYATSTESVVTLAHTIANGAQSIPVFSYFDAAATTTQTSLAEPVSSTLVHVIRLRLITDMDTADADEEMLVTVRNR